MKKFCAIALLALPLLAACDDDREKKVLDHEISFFRDARTSICFAFIETKFWRGPSVYNVTSVECTEHVEQAMRYGG